MKRSLFERLDQKVKGWEFALLPILILEFTIFGVESPKFLMSNVLLGSINDIILIYIIFLFVTSVMITGDIGVQVASIVGLTSIVVGVTWQDFGVNIWTVCIIAIIAAVLCGIPSGFFVVYCSVQPTMITLGGSFLYSGIVLLTLGLSTTQGYKDISGLPDGFTQIASFKLFGVIPSQVLISVGFTVITHLLLRRSEYGRKVFLIGINPRAAEYSDLNSRPIILSIYVLSTISVAIAGIILTSYLGTAKSDIGTAFTLPIITAVVLSGTFSIGGRGDVIGTALAALVIGIPCFGLPLCFRINTQYLDIPVGLLLLIVIIGHAFSVNPEVIKLVASGSLCLSRLKSRVFLFIPVCLGSYKSCK